MPAALPFRAAVAVLALIPESQLPIPVQVLVPVVHALTDGLLQQRFLTPELVPDEAIYAAFAALAGECKPASVGDPSERAEAIDVDHHPDGSG